MAKAQGLLKASQLWRFQWMPKMENPRLEGLTKDGNLCTSSHTLCTPRYNTLVLGPALEGLPGTSFLISLSEMHTFSKSEGWSI